MNSYVEKTQTLNANANPFTPKTKQNHVDTGTMPKDKTASQFNHSQSHPLPVRYQQAEPRPFQQNPHENTLKATNHSDNNTHVQYANAHFENANVNPGNENANCQSEMLGIMKKQNEITSLLIQQQCLSYLPKRVVPIFDGDPLKYHAFIKAFENGVEKNTQNDSDRLYYLEQQTTGLPRELVKSCQHLDSVRGYAKAKALLREEFGNEQKIASAYMDRALSWPVIKTEDVKSLQEYSLFLKGCCNAMEDVQYLHELDMPANMLTIIRKLPYKYRDTWRNVACELQERHQRRATFRDISDFIGKQVRILTDPIFGNKQETPSLT